MERQEVLEFVKKEIKRFKEVEHVEDLMNAGRVEELEGILNETPYDKIRNFSEDLMSLEIKANELEKGELLPAIFYMYGAKLSDWEMWQNEVEIAVKLGKEAGILGKSIAVQMYTADLSDLTIEELVNKEYAEEFESVYNVE